MQKIIEKRRIFLLDDELVDMNLNRPVLKTDSTFSGRILELQLSLLDKTGNDFMDAAVANLSALSGANLTVLSCLQASDSEPMIVSSSAVTPTLRFRLPAPVLAHVRSDVRSCLLLQQIPPDFIPDNRLGLPAVKGYIAVVLRNPSGHPIGILESFFDAPIGESELVQTAFRILAPRMELELSRITSEKTLQELKERYEFALRAGNFGTYEWDRQTEAITIDSKYHEITGFTTGQLTLSYMDWMALLHPDDYEKLVVEVSRKRDGNIEYQGPVNLRVMSSAGRYKWIQYQSYTRLDSASKATRSIGVIKDIDENVRIHEGLKEAARKQEQLHQQIKEREERYSFALKVGKLGVYDWYPIEGRTVLSPILAEIMGVETEEVNLSYDSWLERVHPDDRASVTLDGYNAGSDYPGNRPGLYRFRLSSGEYRWLESHDMAVVVNEQGQISRIIGLVKDVDESKRAADMLSNALEKQKLLNAELLKREQALGDTQKQLLSQMNALEDLNRELRESEARWAYALEGNGDGVIEWNMVSDEVFFSDRAQEILGFGLDHEERRRFLERIHSDARDEFVHSFRYSMQPPFDPFQMEVRIKDDQQVYRSIMFRGKVVEAEGGQPTKMVGTVTDLSQIKLFQKELTIYEQLIKQSQSIILFVTLDGTIEFINPTAIELLGYPQHEIIGQSISTLVGEIEISRILADDFRDQLSLYTRSGSRIVTEVMSSLIRHDGADIGYVFNAIDITEKRSLEERIRALTFSKFEEELEGQRKKTGMVIEVQENEKERIARELHDGVGQLLSLAKLNIEEMEPTLSLHQLNGFRNLKEIVQHISTDIKGLTYELMPLSIRNLGLECALHDLLQRYQGVLEGKVKISCKINLNGWDPEQKMAIHIYRIAQEAVNNSIKYSDATSMSFMCVKFKNSVNLMVEDNGVGFDPEQELAKQDAFGLKTLKERARLINAKLHVNSRIGLGTTISLAIPLP